MANKLVLTVKDMGVLQSFLSRFQNIDTGLLLEITSSKVQAKAGTSDHNLLKYSWIPFDELFEIQSGTLPQLLFVGLFNINSAASTLNSYFKKTTPTITIQYGEIRGANVCMDLSVRGNGLKIKIACTGVNNFIPISDDIVTKRTDTSDEYFSFVLSQTDCQKLRLLGRNYEEQGLSISTNGQSVLMGTEDEFEFEYPLDRVRKSGKMIVQNKKLSLLDIENYTIHVIPETVVFTSTDSNTWVAVGPPPEEVYTEDFEDIDSLDMIM